MRRSTRTGQALLELAIFGTLALLALGFLIRIGLLVNYRQEIQMNTFRRALAAADADAKAGNPTVQVDYLHLRDRLVPDPSTFGIMPRAQAQGSSSVLWGNQGLPGAMITPLGQPATGAGPAGIPRTEQPKTIVRLNEKTDEYRFEDFIDPDSPFLREAHQETDVQVTITQRRQKPRSDKTITSLVAEQTDVSKATFHVRVRPTLTSTLQRPPFKLEGDRWNVP